MTKAQNRRFGRNGEIQNEIVSDVGDSIRNTFVRMANALSGSEGAKIDAWKLRDVGRLFHLEDEVGIAQIELGDLETGGLWQI